MQKERLEALFRLKTRSEWCDILEHTDACFAPVLTMSEAPEHEHNKARKTFISVDGVVQPAPAPRYSRTSTAAPIPLSDDPDLAEAIWRELGIGTEELSALRAEGTLA